MLEKLEELLIRYQELNQKLSDPTVIANRAQWSELAKEHATVETIIQKYEQLKKHNAILAEARELLESGDDELEELAKAEIKENEPLKEALELELNELLAPRDPSDDRNVVLEIRAGTGGEEAALFAADLLRMYMRYCERKNWKFEMTDLNDTEINGIKEATCLISGHEVYRHLKYESGTHRVQRIPATESGGRIHTSAATVAVLPEATDVEVQFGPNDLIIEKRHSTGAGGQHINKTESAIRIVHVPTGIVVSCQDEKSQMKNREQALKVMKSRVYDYYSSQARAEYDKNRRSQVGSGDRSERIRTYNFPQSRVTDHRIGLTLYKLDSFIDGDMDEMISALILAGATGTLNNRQV